MNLVGQLLAAGAHGYAFCSRVQSFEWCKIFKYVWEDVPNFKADSKVEVSSERAIIEVESVCFNTRERQVAIKTTGSKKIFP